MAKIQLVKGPISPLKTQTAVGVITVKQLFESFKADVYDPEVGRIGTKGGYQRSPKENRIKALREKMREGLVVATAILVNVRNPEKQLTFDSKGRAEIDMPTEIWGKDGMHRARAWMDLYENAVEYGLDQEEVGERLINVVFYWGAEIGEEVNTFFDVNNNAKSIPTGNKLEIDAYLTRIGAPHHDGDPLLMDIDDLVKDLATIPQWEGKVQWPNLGANVIPSSALTRSCMEIFSEGSALDGMQNDERLELLTTVWQAIEVVFPEVFADPNKKKYSLQKAIGVSVVHKLVPKIYMKMFRESGMNVEEFSKHVMQVDLWVKFYEKMRTHSDTNQDGADVDGLQFWLSGKSGAAGSYSSGAGRNTLTKIYSNLVLGK